jgi:membrane-associated phospholipid phosphatase
MISARRGSAVFLPIILVLAAVSCASLVGEAERRGGDSVTEWTLIADYYGNGDANWRTLAILQMAMHDALNAAHPVYGRWRPAAVAEGDTAGANPNVAMAAAANEVLQRLHPEHVAETAAAFATVLARYPDGTGKTAGRKLGAAVGRAVVEGRQGDGFATVRYFQGNDSPERWRPTPKDLATSRTNNSRPFLFDSVRDIPTVPPPRIETPAFADQLARTRSIGGSHSKVRSIQQTADAEFWAHQSGQRGFVNLAVALFASHRPSGGVYEEARILSQLTAALADSAILTWSEKGQYSYWRPITAIRAAGDPTWEPLIETPPFPEYPSGHATDCFVGAGILEAAFPGPKAFVVYVSSAFMPALGSEATVLQPVSYGMGQHAQRAAGDVPGGNERRFPTFRAAAENCAASRVWAGAHFPTAEIESKRLAELIVHRALTAPAAVPVGDVAPR